MATLIPSQDTHSETRTGDFAKAEIWQRHKSRVVKVVKLKFSLFFLHILRWTFSVQSSDKCENAEGFSSVLLAERFPFGSQLKKLKSAGFGHSDTFHPVLLLCSEPDSVVAVKVPRCESR